MASIGWILAIGGLARLLIGYHIELRDTKRNLDREHRRSLYLANWLNDAGNCDGAGDDGRLVSYYMQKAWDKTADPEEEDNR